MTPERCLILLMAAAAGLAAQSAGERPLYLDPNQPVERRIDDLLVRMTLKEKIGQMNMPCVYLPELGPDVKSKQEACRRFTEGTYTREIGPGGGFFTLADNALPEGTRQQAAYFNELQKIASEKTRLHIPLLQTEEGTHGVMCSGKTIFPEGLGIGSTWNLDLVREIYAAAAREARAVGIHQIFTLVIEPNRDPRLGRNMEGYSEDPFLCSRIAEAIVTGAQGHDVSAGDKAVAGLCHYPGQSQPVSGLERGAMEISERTLREVFLLPWAAGIHKGALGVMATYPAIDGIPTHASKRILTDILRHELGFEGLVLGEGSGITTLVYERVAKDQKEAGQIALRAGLDVGISYEPGYMGPLVESVQSGKASMEDIDRSVRRILRQKFRLGLFDRPFVDVERAAGLVHSKEHQDLALQVAREGIVLLKNEKNLLPLKKTLKSIAVLGPNADDARNQLGEYVSRTVLQHVVTVLEGIQKAVSPSTRVVHVKGCDVLGTDKSGFAAARQAVRQADVAVVVVGENERRKAGKQGTDGEGKDIANLDLTGVQEDLIREVQGTGTPTVVVLINGRPLSTRWTAEHVPAILEAWSPGERGGTAVAEILFGDTNPSGRLPITIPRHAGQLPVYYNYKPSKAYWAEYGYVDMPVKPLYEFGYGLSYTRFEYSNLNIAVDETPDGLEARVIADVKNVGERPGAEVVQLYVHDEIATVTRPVKELKGLSKVSLKPGEKKTVQFTLNAFDLSMLDADLRRVVEPGSFAVMVGSSSEDLRLKGGFEVKQARRLPAN